MDASVAIILFLIIEIFFFLTNEMFFYKMQIENA